MTIQNTDPLIHELHHQVKVAAEKISESRKPQILTWNGTTIVATSTGGKRADQSIAKSDCLGVYDFNSTPEQIMSDLLVVIKNTDR